MLELYKNIKSKRIELGLTQGELAERTGYADKSMIAKIENGKVDLSQSKIELFAEALHTTPRALMGWEDTDSVPPLPNLGAVTTRSFPVLGSVSCGMPVLMAEEHEVQISADIDIKADFILFAKGDSMIGARIHDGDIVFVRRQMTVENGQIAVVAIDNEATLKRFYRYSDLIVLRAENPSYPDIEIRPSDGKEVHILGLAIRVQGELR